MCYLVVKVGTLIWQAEQQNIPNPAGISNPIAVTYIPVCENSVHIKSVSPVDSSAVLKGVMC